MARYFRPLIMIVTLIVTTGCVTMNNYRSTKAQMLAGEVELHHCRIAIDSLQYTCDSLYWQISRLDTVIGNQHNQINSISSENKQVKEEYALLLDKLKKIESKQNAVQKSSSKTKR